MFIRIKKIKGGKYAYFVRNKWTDKGPRQKSIKYLGKLFELSKKNTASFKEFVKKEDYNNYLETVDSKQLIKDVIEFNLFQHGFSKKGEKLSSDNIILDFSSNTVREAKKKAVLKLNDGYLCDTTLQKSFAFKLELDKSDEELGFQLANLFTSAGIEVPQDVFIVLYEKMVK